MFPGVIPFTFSPYYPPSGFCICANDFVCGGVFILAISEVFFPDFFSLRLGDVPPLGFPFFPPRPFRGLKRAGVGSGTAGVFD